MLLVNQDGSKKPADQIPAPRRFKKPKHKKTRKTLTTQQEVIPFTQPAPSQAAKKGHVTAQEKLDFLAKLEAFSEGRTTVVIRAIVADINSLSKASVVLDLLKR
jgi:hypothetical protein